MQESVRPMVSKLNAGSTHVYFSKSYRQFQPNTRDPTFATSMYVRASLANGHACSRLFYWVIPFFLQNAQKPNKIVCGNFAAVTDKT